MPGYCPDPLCDPLPDSSLTTFFQAQMFGRSFAGSEKGRASDPRRSSDWSPPRFRFSRVGGGGGEMQRAVVKRGASLESCSRLSAVSPRSKEAVGIKMYDWCQAWDTPTRLFRWRTGFKQPLESLRGVKSQDRSFGFPEEPRTICYVITSALMGISRLMCCFFQ